MRYAASRLARVGASPMGRRRLASRVGSQRSAKLCHLGVMIARPQPPHTGRCISPQAGGPDDESSCSANPTAGDVRAWGSPCRPPSRTMSFRIGAMPSSSGTVSWRAAASRTMTARSRPRRSAGTLSAATSAAARSTLRTRGTVGGAGSDLRNPRGVNRQGSSIRTASSFRRKSWGHPEGVIRQHKRFPCECSFAGGIGLGSGHRATAMARCPSFITTGLAT